MKIDIDDNKKVVTIKDPTSVQDIYTYIMDWLDEIENMHVETFIDYSRTYRHLYGNNELYVCFKPPWKVEFTGIGECHGGEIFACNMF